jgi:uncharacterized membrane protein
MNKAIVKSAAARCELNTWWLEVGTDVLWKGESRCVAAYTVGQTRCKVHRSGVNIHRRCIIHSVKTLIYTVEMLIYTAVMLIYTTVMLIYTAVMLIYTKIL